jgi:esterase/lipase
MDPQPDAPVEAEEVHDAETPRRGPVRPVLRWVGLVLAALLLVVVGLAVWPANLDGLDTSRAIQATSYDDAMAKFHAWADDEPAKNVFEPCKSAVYGQEKQSEVAVVLFHGLTNCPAQYQEFAQELADKGMNVLVLRAPHHGIANADGTAIGEVSLAKDLSAEDLIRWSDASVDIATGLGTEVRVLGLSMGGVAASWVAQNRSVERVVAIAPALTLHGMPSLVDTAVLNAVPRLPHFTLHASTPLDHAYAGETVHGAAEMYRLAAAVRREAAEQPPATLDITVITNPADNQVDNRDIEDLVDSWKAHGADVEEISLDFGVDLPHDVVDPGQPTGRTDLTWPVFMQALE